ncbi:MAG: PAS domain S-box protein [Gemmatimonadota bacterium]
MAQGLDNDAEFLRKVLEDIPDVILVVDGEGTIRYINHVEEGYDRDEVVGSPADAIMTPESKEVFWSTVESVMEEEQEREYESEVVAPDGSVQWYRSRMSSIHRFGEVVGVLVRTTNVSALKAEQEMNAQMRRLLPMCSWCDKIRNDQDEWETIESYLEETGGTTVTHGMCPDCYERHLESSGGEGNGNAA